MERLRNRTLHLASIVRALFSVDARHLKIQLTALAIVFCILMALIQMKQVIRGALLELHTPIYALDKTGTPGAAKIIPCASHPGKACGTGVFANAIAQFHGCCGPIANTTGGSNP